MLGVELRILQNPDGTPVANVSFDLSADQLAAAARAVEATRIRRHRSQEMTTDDVLAMRELAGVGDELQRLADYGAHGTVVLPLARFSTMHDALLEWTSELDARGWARELEIADRPIVAALAAPMANARVDALRALIGGVGTATQDPHGRPPSAHL